MRKAMTAAVSAAAVLALGVGASNAAAVTITPANTAVVGTATNSQLVAGSQTLTCSTSVTNGTTPASGGVVPLSPPSFNTCSSAIGSFTVASNATNGSWALTATSTTTGTLTIPKAGVKVTYLGGLCTINVTPAGPTTISGTWSNATSTISIVNQAIPITTSGFCPGVGTTSSFSADYVVSPSVTVS